MTAELVFTAWRRIAAMTHEPRSAAASAAATALGVAAVVPTLFGSAAAAALGVSIVLSWLFSCPANAQISFKEATKDAGFTHAGDTWGSAWADLNGDGCLDLFVSNHFDSPSLYKNRCDGTFEDIAPEAIENFASEKGDLHGPAWGDYDNDGDPDLVLTAGGARGARTKSPSSSNRLFENRDGRLVNRAEEVNVNQPGARGRSPLWSDFDGDGRLDLILNQEDPLNPADMFLRQANGKFLPCSPGPDWGSRSKWKKPVTTRVRLLDSDQPLLVFGGREFPPELWRHAEGCRFQRLPVNGLKTIKQVRDFTSGDFNGDLRTDFFVATQGKSNEFVSDGSMLAAEYRVPSRKNLELDVRSPGPFSLYIGPQQLWPTDRMRIGLDGHTPRSKVLDLSPDDPANLGMPDLEGLRDGIGIGYLQEQKLWRILTLADKSKPLYFQFTAPAGATIERSNLPLNEDSTLLDYLFIDNGNTLSDVSAAFGMAAWTTNCGSAGVGDYDNDMDLDIYLVCGNSLSNLPNRLYENVGNERFAQLPDRFGATGSLKGSGNHVSIADYDNDGFLDLFVANGEGPKFAKGGPHQLFRNQGNSNNWMKIDLVGTRSNRDAFGSRVFMTAGGITQLREKTGGMRRGVQDSQVLHFGLAKESRIDAIVVQWPDGRIERFPAQEINKSYRLEEGSSEHPEASPEIALMASRHTYEAGQGQTFISVLGSNVERGSVRWQMPDAAECGHVPVCRGTIRETGTFDVIVSAKTQDGTAISAQQKITVR